MRTKDKPGSTKGQKKESGGPPDQNQKKSHKQSGTHDSRAAMKESHPDKHGGSGTGRQQGGSGSGRER